MAVAAPERLYYTDSDEANELIATDPLALLIGFALDQQVTVPTAFLGPLKIKQRLGTLAIANRDPADVDLGKRLEPRPGNGRRNPADQRASKIARESTTLPAGEFASRWTCAMTTRCARGYSASVRALA